MGTVRFARAFEFSDKCLRQRSARTLCERQRITFRPRVRLHGQALEKHRSRNDLSDCMSHRKLHVHRFALVFADVRLLL